MKLEKLIEGCDISELTGNISVDIAGITCDSRDAGEGNLFAAIRGACLDGHNFIDDAVKKGAAAILLEDRPLSTHLSQLSGVTGIRVPDSRKALGLISSKFFGEPSKRLKLAGITGTNGKTTTAYLLEAILKAAGLSTGVLGTVNYRYADRVLDAKNTTPHSTALQRLFSDMVNSGTTHCVMEVSSHALDQRRVEGCSFDAAIFTNLTQDHLDYHSSMETYGRAKEQLFTDMPDQDKVSVINTDDPFGKVLAERTQNVITYSLEGGGISPLEINYGANGLDAVFCSPLGDITVRTNLVGDYNVCNIMAAIGGAVALGIGKDAIESGIGALPGIPGRLERVALPETFENCRVFVDYAHTPDALERAIRALRPTTRGRLITLFGCGGDRDKEKRGLMGGVSLKESDFTIITSDNPRSEDPFTIIKAIEVGAVAAGGSEGKNYSVVVDRREAITKAAGMVEKGDTLLIAGKGHEDYQIIGDRVIGFDDRVEAKRAFNLDGSCRKVA